MLQLTKLPQKNEVISQNQLTSKWQRQYKNSYLLICNLIAFLLSCFASPTGKLLGFWFFFPFGTPSYPQLFSILLCAWQDNYWVNRVPWPLPSIDSSQWEAPARNQRLECIFCILPQGSIKGQATAPFEWPLLSPGSSDTSLPSLGPSGLRW